MSVMGGGGCHASGNLDLVCTFARALKDRIISQYNYVIFFNLLAV